MGTLFVFCTVSYCEICKILDSNSAIKEFLRKQTYVKMDRIVSGNFAAQLVDALQPSKQNKRMSIFSLFPKISVKIGGTCWENLKIGCRKKTRKYAANISHPETSTAEGFAPVRYHSRHSRHSLLLQVIFFTMDRDHPLFSAFLLYSKSDNHPNQIWNGHGF